MIDFPQIPVTDIRDVLIARQKDRIDQLEKQRDELLAALRKLSGMKLNMIANGIVDKAIARVKGGAA